MGSSQSGNHPSQSADVQCVSLFGGHLDPSKAFGGISLAQTYPGPPIVGHHARVRNRMACSSVRERLDYSGQKAERDRTFTRDAKCVHEREQALRLIRAVITLPVPPPPSRPASRRRRSSHSRPRSSHSRQASASVQEQVHVFKIILEQRVPLTDGIMRSIVSVAENQDDALRTICMQTLIEIGESRRWCEFPFRQLIG